MKIQKISLLLVIASLFILNINFSFADSLDKNGYIQTEYGSYNYINTIELSKDGKNIGEGTIILKDGIGIGKYYDDIIDYTFDNDNNIIYIAKKDGKTLLVKNGIEISDTYDYSIKNIIFLKEFNSFVYIKLNKNGNPYAGTIILLKSKNNNQTTTKTEETKIPTTDKSTYTKQLILSKNALNKSSKYKKYISQVDKLVLNLSKEKGEQVLAKIQKLKKKNDIIKYLEAKIYLQLNK